jgi:hypothetical protein
VTLGLVEEHVPPAQTALITHWRQRLRELATEIEGVNRSNALIVWWCLNFVQGVFAAIQGHSTGGRYSALGKAEAGARGPIWQSQG